MPRALSVVLLLIGTFIAAYACFDGDTPENDSLRNGDAGMTGELRLGFYSELALIYGKVNKPDPCGGKMPADRWVAIGQIADLIEAELIKSGRTEAKAEAELIRAELGNYLSGSLAFGELLTGAGDAAERLPACYRLYLRSLTPDRTKAIAAIEELLALPKEERRPLSAVAHYRRGRLLEFAIRDEDLREQAGKEQTVERLRSMRESLGAVEGAIQEGSPDIAWVGAAARGWLADSHSHLPMDAGEMLKEEVDIRRAAELLLGLRADGYAIGQTDLRSLMSWLAVKPGGLELCREDPELRRLMTLYLCAHSESWIYRQYEEERETAIARWLETGFGDSVEADENTVRIALLHYRKGNYGLSERLVAKCPPDDAAAAMLRSRLELRLGRRLEAAKALEEALPRLGVVEDFPDWGVQEDIWETGDKGWVFVKRDQTNSADGKLRAELALLKLALGDYPAALRLKLAAGLQWDSRYVAECVMTVDELKAFVDAEAMGKRVRKRGWGEYDERTDTIDLNEEIRVLLARRLCRAERWTEAKAYVRPGMAAVIDAYLGHLARAQDTKNGDRERADAYWRAALVMREHGRELLYCDFGPEWTSGKWIETKGKVDGWHEKDWPRCRIEPTQAYPWNPLTGPAADERQRVAAWLAANTAPGNRHNVLMRYRVFDLAMKAVALLPDNDPAGAEIAQSVGNGLRYVDPPYANAAYKALAIRFKETPYGKHAFEKRWFLRDYDPPEPNPDWILKPVQAPGR